MEINGNDPFYPVQICPDNWPSKECPQYIKGASARAVIAMHAMVGILASMQTNTPDAMARVAEQLGTRTQEDTITAVATVYADALIRRLNQKDSSP